MNPRDLYRVYAATLFFALHIALITYVHSTYLERFVAPSIVGILYTIGALIGIIVLSRTPHILRLLGNRHFMIAIGIAEIIALTAIGFSSNAYIVILFFILHQALVPVLYFSFDIFIKHFSTASDTGTSRGIFLSIINVAYVVIPLITGLILSYGSFKLVYGLSLALVIPLLYFIASIKGFKDPLYHDTNLTKSIRESYKNRNVRSIIAVNLILQMFYATMVIYMPIFLHQQMHFSWATIGIMFTIMLTPFVIFELPLGKISDALLGEKELLIIGLVIIAAFTGIVPFMTSTSAIDWTILLFMTRVGASFVEIMAESYFFKKVHDEDANLLSLWRTTNNGSYAIIPIIISGALLLVGIEHLAWIFFIMALITAFGIIFALRLEDTL